LRARFPVPPRRSSDLILYATNVLGVSVAQYGLLVAIQIMTSILVYIPAGRIADRVGRKPFVIATFICFSLYPVAVVMSTGFASLDRKSTRLNSSHVKI